MSTLSRPFPLKTTLGIAAITVAAIGAISGKAIGSTPMLMEDTASAVAGTRIDRDNFAAIAAEDRPPDHYDLVTPEGTIPVAELSLHGRLRGRSDSWWEGADPVMLDASYDDEFSDREIEQLALAEPVVRDQDVPAEQDHSGISTTGTNDGTVRIVDVSAAVAGAAQY
ncbi:hypothetical protein [Qipengyuania sp. RANM35]|uniref:hypothetical protein n=1 Tax=Qipengyuania sp. RANM35 TaxID=3068635 RepID=UPI0034DB6249